MSQTVHVNERLAALVAAGTSPWLDQIRRSLTRGGELRRLIEEDCLRGETSNPAIFEKAILGSSDYDDQIQELAEAGGDARGIYRGIAVADVQDAADVLRTVYDETGGDDGYVSLEVDPDLAHDTDLTIAQAREYWAAVDRPNLMIKIPGTDAGVPAIEQAVFEGINVNVTLLFGVEAYSQVAEAFIRGLERRRDEGKSVDVHSVASFFVSRVDTEVDKRLDALGAPEELHGRAGLANARAAYQRFKQIFRGERFAALREAGAPVQRPLWASTGVKNPKYPATLYVDGLVAPDTVNTMPMDTLLAAAKEARIEGPTADQDPTPDLQALAAAGIDMDDVTDKLLRDGITAFVTPMEKLLAGIESKREAIVTQRPPAIESALPDELEQGIAQRVRKAAEEHVARRIWSKDDTLWGPAGQPEVANRLGWLNVTEQMEEELDDLEAFTREVLADGLTDAVLLGMGGSSLAPEVIRRSFGEREGFLRLHVLDSTDAAAVRDVEARIDLDKTLFIVATKSGGTIETLSAYTYFHAKQGDGRHFVAITDPGSSLVDLASEAGFRRTFLADPDIGGRYSALSHFGLVPAALIGADVRGLLASAGVAREACAQHDSSRSNSGLWLGVTLGELALRGRDKLTFVISSPVESFGLWVEQLVAESTGKEGKGILPVAGEPLGAPDVYGEDRVFVYLRNEDSPLEELEEATGALARAGLPVITVSVKDDPADLGRIFFFSEFATAVAGWVLGINPFDQPNVQEAKDNTRRVLDERTPEQPDADDDALRALLGDAAPPAYVATMAYVAPGDAFDAAIAELRTTIRDARKASTTFGYGPRFLHSTGQLHKGGPRTGRFLQLVHHAEPDVAIPGAPYTFEGLKRAQATGDLQTLRDHGLPAERVTLTGDPVQAVRDLTQRIKEML
ncbi:MAG: transaldolase / glucose-6-phosphate isomerase [Solirubrobacteraceae bacterium]|jgi:transaldolase/glucose-6-phosphate isomerase|nr:transaldolase / glucose-6-phosphate isomerase [Solirubrobacteraceae bacterium]